MSSSILHNRFYRRYFLIAAALSGAVLLGLRFIIVPNLHSTIPPEVADALSEIIDSLFGALLASVATTFLVAWLTAPEKTNVMEVVEPRRIRDVLQYAIRGTDEWWYRGHIGQYFTSVLLPMIARDARAENTRKKIYLIILDPTNKQLCGEFAAYRNMIRSARKSLPWTADSARNLLYATVVSAYAWRTEEPLLELNIAFTDQISQFRIEIASNLVLITQEDPQEPALRFDRGTSLYNSYGRDVNLTYDRSRQLARQGQVPARSNLQADDIRNLFKQLVLPEHELTDSDITEILRIVQVSENPYP